MVPDCKPEFRVRMTYEFLTRMGWNYFGGRKGQCPDCNLFTPLKEEKTP